MDRTSKEKLDLWKKHNARVVEADYDDIPSLENVFKDGDRVYIVSGLQIGHRVVQHKDVYVTPDHTATEEYLKIK